MYIKKSFISGLVIAIGAIILAALAVLYCFTEIRIPQFLYMIAWIGCILAVVDIVGRVER